MIRADFELLADRTPAPLERAPASLRQPRRTRRTSTKTPERQAFPPPAPIPAWARASGRAGQGDPLFAAGAALALLDACLRADPPAAGALRARLALQSAAASAKILRLNADEAALRDLRFAVGRPARARGEPLVALARCRRPAAQPRPRPDSRRGGAAGPGSAGPERPRIQPEGLCRGGRSGFGGRKGRGRWPFPPSRTPAPPIRNFSALGVRHGHRHPAPLAAARAADRDENPGSDLASPGAGRRPRPGDPAWPNAAAGAIALAAASALDLAADLSRRSKTLIAVAPKLAIEAGGQNRRPAARPRLRLARRSGPPRADDRPRRPPAVRPARRAWRRARVFGPAHLPAVRPMTAAARRRQREGDESLDVELIDLPPAARWREWMLRVEAAIFASQKPVPREALVRLVGEACRFDDLIADLIHELRGRPYDLTLVAGGYALRTKTRFAPAIRAAHPGLGGDDVAELTRTETFALTAIAYLQPVTRGEISRLAGREISRDIIAALKRHGLIDGAIRAPQPGAPFAYVTTRKFLEAFGFASLRDLPDLERLKAEGLLREGRGRMISIARSG